MKIQGNDHIPYLSAPYSGLKEFPQNEETRQCRTRQDQDHIPYLSLCSVSPRWFQFLDFSKKTIFQGTCLFFCPAFLKDFPFSLVFFFLYVLRRVKILAGMEYPSIIHSGKGPKRGECFESVLLGVLPTLTLPT